MRMLKAAVIGLGNIGFQFNLDPLRKGTRSHVAAYQKCNKTKLLGAVEVNKEKINIFKKYYKNIPVFRTVKELMRNLSIDMVSICTPTSSHYSILRELIAYPIKAIFCEKPLALNIAEGKKMIQMCKKNKVILAVNHTRRWDSSYLFVKKIIKSGRIGKIKAISAFYSGQIFNIGTHLFDAISMLIEKNVEALSGFFSDKRDNSDPSISGWIKFNGDIPCTVITTGKKEDLIFEIDILGNEGRIRILENGQKVECYTFTKSKRYSGYRELELMPLKMPIKKDRFVEAINNICTAIQDKKNYVCRRLFKEGGYLIH